MRSLFLFFLTLLPLYADTVYSNLLNDTGASLIFNSSLTEAGDQIQFSQANSLLAQARIGTYNEAAVDITSDVTLRIYDVDLTDPMDPVLSILGTFTLLNYTFSSRAVELINFTLNGLPVGLNAVWTLAFSSPTGLGINNFGDATLGSSLTESYWANVSPGALTYQFFGGSTDLNFQAEFIAVPEPGTLALSALALGALLLRRLKTLAIVPFVLLATSPSFAANKETVPAGDWAQIKAEYERHRHQISNNQAHSPYQGWTTKFTPTGFLVTPKDGNWTWGLNLNSYGLADQIQPISAPTQSTTKVNELRHQHGNLTHWFINAPSGLEEGWTIHSRPEGSAKDLLIQLEAKGSLAPRANNNAVHFLNPTQQTILNYSGLKAWDATGKPLVTTMTAQGDEIQISVNQQDATYPITVDPTAQQAYLKASNTEARDLFGESVAISGDTIVVGARGEDSNATGVNGAPNNNSAENSGAVYVFTRSAGTWSQQAYLKASNTDINDAFGYSVAISANTIVVGAPDESGSGAAYVFTRTASTWSQQAYLKASNPRSNAIFGNSVAISGDTIVVGSAYESSNATGVNGDQSNERAQFAGAVYVFTRIGSPWTQQAYLKASNTFGGQEFGRSVAISGDTVVVGAMEESSNATGVNGDQANRSAFQAGAAYVFTRAATTWSQEAYLKASNTQEGDRFGISVAISANTIVVGAPIENSNATGVNGNQTDSSANRAGAAYVFTRAVSLWSQQAYLKASNTATSGLFGYSVAIADDTIVVGAVEEDSNTTGVNGNQTNNSALDSGAAYVFTRSASTWSQQLYLKASNTGVEDYFGTSVAITGDTIVVGAVGETSSATGVNGNQSDNSLFEAGAAYVFTIGPDTTNVTINSNPSNLLFSSTGTGCAASANLATPQILAWTPASSCQVTFGNPQSGGAGTQFVFSQWENASTNASRNIIAPMSPTTYTATFNTQYLLTVTANPPVGGTVTPSAATFFNANSIQPVTATASGCYAFANWTGATVTGGNVTTSAPINLTANFTLPSSTPTTKGPVLTVRGTPNRYRQSVSVTNTTSSTADISIALSSLGSGVSVVTPAPTGTSTSCLPPSGSPYFTLTNVPPGQGRTVTIDFNAPSAAAVTYTATAITGPGPR